MRIYEADGTVRARHHLLDAGFHPQCRGHRGRPYEDWRDRVLDGAAHAWSAAWWPTCRSACCCPAASIPASSSACWPRPASTGLMTFSIGFEEAHGEKGDEFVYSDLIARALRDRPPQDLRPVGAADGCAARHHRRHVGAHGVLRQCRLLPPVAGGREAHQGGAVGQGADEVFGGYHWYPPLAASNDPVGGLCQGVSSTAAARTLKRSWRPSGWPKPTSAGSLSRPSIRPPRRGECGRQGAAPGPTGDAGRRSGEAGRQHDHGLGLEARVPFLDHELANSPHASRRSTSCAMAARAS
jgi:asparagine synthase (glutamine-hydrolysing)